MALMWVRSYEVDELLAIPVGDATFCIMSQMGRIFVGKHKKPIESRQKPIEDPDRREWDLRSIENTRGFAFRERWGYTDYHVPYWTVLIPLLVYSGLRVFF